MFKKKGERSEKGLSDLTEKGLFTSENRGAWKRSKNIKKIIDDLMAILSLTKTSADASRYRCAVKAAGLMNRQSRLLPMERSGWPSH